MQQEFAGKAVLVTGAGGGIGLAAANAFCAAGAQVGYVDIGAASSDVGPGGVTFRADVADPASCEAVVTEAVDRFGRLDVLVNSAGIQRYGSVADTPVQTWQDVLAVNLSGAFYMSKFAIPHLLAAGGGAIVHVASVQAFTAQRGVAAYSASKGGLVALTRAMAVDHAPAIRVNVVCPGSVDTPMLRASAREFAPEEPERLLAEWGAMHPMDRIAKPEEVAAAILFLASPRASFVTGEAMRVDGGLLSRLGGL